MIILDSDHLSILQYHNSASAAKPIARLNQPPEKPIATSIANVEEAMRGWLSAIAKERRIERQIIACVPLLVLKQWVPRDGCHCLSTSSGTKALSGDLSRFHFSSSILPQNESRPSSPRAAGMHDHPDPLSLVGRQIDFPVLPLVAGGRGRKLLLPHPPCHRHPPRSGIGPRLHWSPGAATRHGRGGRIEVPADDPRGRRTENKGARPAELGQLPHLRMALAAEHRPAGKDARRGGTHRPGDTPRPGVPPRRRIGGGQVVCPSAPAR